MGNLPLKSCGTVGGISCKIRVLLPDGQLVALDGPVEVIEMMQQYPNHMVVHCSSDPLATGETPSMKIMLPDQQLSTGEAYVIYPVPPQYKTILLVAQSYSASKQSAGHAGQIDSEEAEGETKPCKIRSMRLVASLLPTRLAPGCKSEEKAQDETQSESLLKSDVGKDDGSHGRGEESDLSFFMGWKPALESIPESPHGHEVVPDSPINVSTRPIEVL